MTFKVLKMRNRQRNSYNEQGKKLKDKENLKGGYQNDKMISNTILVENIPFMKTKFEIQSYFSSLGEVSRVKMLRR